MLHLETITKLDDCPAAGFGDIRYWMPIGYLRPSK